MRLLHGNSRQDKLTEFWHKIFILLTIFLFVPYYFVIMKFSRRWNFLVFLLISLSWCLTVDMDTNTNKHTRSQQYYYLDWSHFIARDSLLCKLSFTFWCCQLDCLHKTKFVDHQYLRIHLPIFEYGYTNLCGLFLSACQHFLFFASNKVTKCLHVKSSYRKCLESRRSVKN